MSFKRILQPSVTTNYRDITYSISSLRDTDVRDILSRATLDGIIGIEVARTPLGESTVLFSPPHFKTNFPKTNRIEVFNLLNERDENLTFVKVFTGKSSCFPIEMNPNNNLWNIIRTHCPNHINIMYQILLAFRQDNWQERLIEQYEDYKGGIEQPSDNGFLRKLQRKLNEKVDAFLKWDYQHSSIEEFERKIEEIGFRYNIRFILQGGNKKERHKIVEKIRMDIDELSYMNNIVLDTYCNDNDILNIKNRKMDNTDKSGVLSLSELLMFTVIDSNINNTKIVDLKPLPMEKADNIYDTYNPMELLPFGDEIGDVDGNLVANRFINAVSEVKNLKGNKKISVRNIQSGATLMKLSFSMPSSVRLSDLNKKSVIDDIQNHMGIKNLQIRQGEEQGEVDILLPLEKRQKVFLRNYIDNELFSEFSKNNQLPFLVGVDEIGNPIYQCLNKAKHILIAGTTGSGKSVWLNQLILTLLLVKSPKDLQMYMIDIKQVELPIYEKFPHVQSVITDADESIELLDKLVAEVNRRYELFKNIGVKTIGLYNNKVKDKIPYIICVIDEYAELALRNPDVHLRIQTITQLSRACGIHLIVATQDPRKEVILPIIKSNLPSKIGLRCGIRSNYMTFLNSHPPNLLGNGDGVMCFEGQLEEHIRFQGCLIVDDERDEGLEAELIEKIANMMTGDRAYVQLPDVEKSSNEDKDLVELKRIIATTRETRVSKLRDIMKININKLNDLMKELVDEGWLEAPKSRQSGYVLLLSDEELENM